MSASRMVTTPPEIWAEAVTTSTCLLPLRSLAGPTFHINFFPQTSVRRTTPAPVVRRVWMEAASGNNQGTTLDSELDLSGTPGTGRFLF